MLKGSSFDVRTILLSLSLFCLSTHWQNFLLLLFLLFTSQVGHCMHTQKKFLCPRKMCRVSESPPPPPPATFSMAFRTFNTPNQEIVPRALERRHILLATIFPMVILLGNPTHYRRQRLKMWSLASMPRSQLHVKLSRRKRRKEIYEDLMPPSKMINHLMVYNFSLHFIIEIGNIVFI